jgi:hypothetical protein
MSVVSAVSIRASASDCASENMRIRPGVRSSENRGRSREWRAEDEERMKRRPFENELLDHRAGKVMRGRVETADEFREMSTLLFNLGLVRMTGSRTLFWALRSVESRRVMRTRQIRTETSDHRLFLRHPMREWASTTERDVPRARCIGSAISIWRKRVALHTLRGLSGSGQAQPRRISVSSGQVGYFGRFWLTARSRRRALL